MKDTKINNLLDMEQFSEKDIFKSNKTTKRTDVAKDVLQEHAYVVGKDVLGGSLKNKETHAARGLNNLICLDDFTKSVPSTSAKATKRTDVAKDVIQEHAYVVGKDVLGGSLKNKETHAAKGLNNLICLDDFTKSAPSTSAKATKRTDVAKDVLLEKKKAKAKKEEDCEDCEKEKKGKKGDCVSAKQAKLPWNKGKKIC